MEKLEKLLKHLEVLLKVEEEKLREAIEDEEEADLLIPLVEKLETSLAKLLRQQKNYILDSIDSFVSKDPLLLTSLITYLAQEVFPGDTFEQVMEKLMVDSLTEAVEILTSLHLQRIDPDLKFKKISPGTSLWIEAWATQIASAMADNTHAAIAKIPLKELEGGGNIDSVRSQIDEMTQFNRNRARLAALTEMLTANTASQYESFIQTPAVVAKGWRHTHTGQTQRPHHVELDGTEIPVTEYFTVGDEQGLYPRDTNLSRQERINCYCAMYPVIDDTLLEIPIEEKEEYQDQALE